MNRSLKTIILFSVFLIMPMFALAQSDMGIWYNASVEKKLSKKWTVGIDGEFRTRNDAQTADRWDIGASIDYKIVKHLRASAGYNLINDNNKEKITYHNDGSYNNWRPSYWGMRHRFHFDIVGSIDVGRIKMSLRERLQYTYRPSKTTTRYDFDHSQWEDTNVKGKGKNVLRSRLQASWDIPHCKIEPYANVESFNSWNLTKMRYTAGVDWKITKQHTAGLYYRYQDIQDNDDEDNEPDSHIVGISYKFKF